MARLDRLVCWLTGPGAAIHHLDQPHTHYPQTRVQPPNQAPRAAHHCSVGWTSLVGCLVGWLTGPLGLGDEYIYIYIYHHSL
jgi:hypothetical protein